MSVIPSEDCYDDCAPQRNVVCRLSTTTSVTFLSRYYRFVFLLDIGQALACIVCLKYDCKFYKMKLRRYYFFSSYIITPF